MTQASTTANLKPPVFNVEGVIHWEDVRDDWYARIDYAASLKIRHLPMLPEHEGRCLIVGAGPSITHQLEKLKELRQDGMNLLASINGAHDWLLKHVTKPNIHVIFEHDLENDEQALGGAPHPEVTYYLSSITKPQIFQALESCPRVLWHAFLPPQEYITKINETFSGEIMVSGGWATLFRTLAIGYFLGYREFDLFGCDSSFSDSSHVKGYKSADVEPVVSIYGRTPQGGLSKFKTQGGLAYQVSQILEFCEYHKDALKIRVHGDGLLKYVHESRYPEWYLGKGT